jgi:hypothetical protein
VADATIEELNGLGGLLGYLRGLAGACEPPVGVGSFVVLYASEREVVVWYSPVREEHREGEVAIPCRWVGAAWGALVAGQVLDEVALEALGEGPAGGRWLLALLAQAPGVEVRQPLALAWSVELAERRLRVREEAERQLRKKRGARGKGAAVQVAARSEDVAQIQ